MHEWQIRQLTSAGTSHVAKGCNCDDYTIVATDGDRLIACTADGAGSYEGTANGAKAICEALARLALTGPVPDDRRRLEELVNQAITQASQGLPKLSMTTTLNALFIDSRSAAAMQVGDGNILIGCSGSWDRVFTPFKGEYANQTDFVNEIPLMLQLDVFPASSFNSFVLTTDGLTCAVMKKDVPNNGWLDTLTDLIGRLDANDYLVKLTQYLDSRIIRDMTDDDLGLIIGRLDCT